MGRANGGLASARAFILKESDGIVQWEGERDEMPGYELGKLHDLTAEQFVCSSHSQEPHF